MKYWKINESNGSKSRIPRTLPGKFGMEIVKPRYKLRRRCIMFEDLLAKIDEHLPKDSEDNFITENEKSDVVIQLKIMKLKRLGLMKKS